MKDVWSGMRVRLVGPINERLRKHRLHRGHKHVFGVVSHSYWCDDTMAHIRTDGGVIVCCYRDEFVWVRP